MGEEVGMAQTTTATTSSVFKHLVIVKFKEDVKVDEILKGLEKLVHEIDSIKSFEWGQDMEGQEELRKGFTHVFMMTFEKKQDYIDFVSHPIHVDFSSTFSAAIDQIVLLDFPSSLLPKPTIKTSPPNHDHHRNNDNNDDDDGDEKKKDLPPN